MGGSASDEGWTDPCSSSPYVYLNSGLGSLHLDPCPTPVGVALDEKVNIIL